MECQVRSMAASRIAEDVSIPEGKVQAVCREWLVREDGVLAYKLQSEEIQNHYVQNKEKNQLVRSDFQEARSAQQCEEEDATMVKLAYEKMLKEQEDRDAFIAQQLQEKLLKEELAQQKLIEEEDQRIALELQKKEKLRLQKKREERELRQAEKARAELSGASSSSSIKSVDDLVATKEACTSPLEKRFSSLSLEPPPNLTPEELQKFIEQRDAELARLLQEQEMKGPNDSILDRQIAIEAQDRELAKLLQEQERARARKAREKARQKAALAQQQATKVSPDIQPYPDDTGDETTSSKERLKDPDWSTVDRRSYTLDFLGEPVDNIAARLDPTFKSSSNMPNASSSPMSSSVGRKNHTWDFLPEPVANMGIQLDPAFKSSNTSPSQISSIDRRNHSWDFLGEPVDNIATQLDPTFKNSNTPHTSPSQLSSPGSHASSPSTEVSPYAIGTISDGIFVGSEDESIAPPYMPIQGTRRPTSLEKRKKSKKSKDGCKTQ